MLSYNILLYALVGLIIISTGSIILNIIQRNTINNLRTHSQTLIKDAYFNPITSLPNEANFDILLKEQIDRAFRHKKSFLLAYIKLKHYQNDEDIKKAGDKLSESIRNEDALAHINYDEFVIIFNEYLEAQNYDIVLKRIIAAFPKYSIRLGKAVYPNDGEDKKYLLKSAKEDSKR